MSIFGTIMQKIFHAAPAAGQDSAPDAGGATTAPAADTTAAPAAAAGSAPAASVDVGAVLTAMAAQKGGGGNWQTSIVDLLKLLDLDSSLTARKSLADELSVRVGADGSAEENVALHKAVMQKLAENGGKVPDSLKN